MMVFDSEASSIKNYTARTYTNSSKTYTIKGNLIKIGDEAITAPLTGLAIIILK